MRSILVQSDRQSQHQLVKAQQKNLSYGVSFVIWIPGKGEKKNEIDILHAL